MQVQKRNGDVVEFSKAKVEAAVEKARHRTDNTDSQLKTTVSDFVVGHLSDSEVPHVDEVHELVEDGLMDAKAFSVAREYITYRDKHMPDIFRPRTAYKPFEYPHLASYVDAIQQSYWIVSEYNFTSDIHDFKAVLKPHEKEAVKRCMLAISQVEVAVKTFWGKLGDRLPIPEIQEVGATFAESECHIAGTEILTPNGWVDFRDIGVGDDVFQYHPETEMSSTTTVQGVVNEPYKGKIYSVKKQKLEFHVTPNHRFIYKNRRSGELVERTVGDLNGRFHSTSLLPSTTYATGAQDELTDKECLWIALQADGNERFWRNHRGECINRGLSSGCHSYDITLKKERKKHRLENILKKVGYTYRQYDMKREGYVKYEIDVPLEDVEYSLKTLDWVDLGDKSREYCESFIQELVEWDGHRLPEKKDCKMKYTTTVKKCADVVQMVGTMAGYNTRINTYIDSRKESYKDVYTVSFVSQPAWVGSNMQTTEYDYDGTVHCVTVDSGYIITRSIILF